MDLKGMTFIQVFHNVTGYDADGPASNRAYCTRDPLVLVYQGYARFPAMMTGNQRAAKVAAAGQARRTISLDDLSVLNGIWRERGLRSITTGDVISIGEEAYSVAGTAAIPFIISLHLPCYRIPRHSMRILTEWQSRNGTTMLKAGDAR